MMWPCVLLPTYCRFVSSVNSGRRWVIAEVAQPTPYGQ
jgi:hypothetical protein